MKRYLPYAIAAGVPLVLVVLLISAPMARSSRAKLDSEIELKLAAARRLLNAYEPAEQMLLATNEQLHGKNGPMPLNDQVLSQWSADWSKACAEASTPDYPLQPLTSNERKEWNAAESALAAAGGQPAANAVTTAANPANAYHDVEQWLHTNEGRLKEAIDLVDSALRLSVTSGGETFSGRDNGEANRLRAILSFHYAESLRRSAMLDRFEIDRLYARLLRVHGKWLSASRALSIAETFVEGGTLEVPGRDSVTTQPQPATATQAAAQGNAPEGAEETARAPADQAKRGLLSRIMAKVSLPGAVTRAAEAPQDTAAGAPEAQENQTQGAAEPASNAAVMTTRPITVPSMDDRIVQYEEEKAAVQVRIAKLEESIAALNTAIGNLEARIQQKRAEAQAADRTMVDMENKGFATSDPKALQEQLSEFAAASKVNRDAASEADLLEHGGYTNAVLVSETPDLQNAAVRPAQPGQSLESVKTIGEYKRELAIAEAQLAGERIMAGIFTHEIAARQELRESLTERIEGKEAAAAAGAQRPGLRARRDALRKEIDAIASAVRQAYQDVNADNDAALAALDEGIQAAQRTKQSVARRRSDARAAQPIEGTPNPRLTAIQNEEWREGDAEALIGDLQLLKAWINYQRSMADVRFAGVRKLLTDAQVTWEPPANLPTVEDMRSAALESATAALQQYEQAAGAMKNDWTLHVDMAAAAYLLAQLTEGQPADEYRQRAIKEYQLATQGEETSPERAPYAARLQSILRRSARPAG